MTKNSSATTEKNRKPFKDYRIYGYAVAFGVLWALIEMSVGTTLHTFKVPFKGAFLSSIGILLLSVQRYTLNVRYVTLLSGIVCLSLRFAFVGSLFPNPTIAIFMEALFCEVIFSIFSVGYFQASLAGIIALVWTFFQKVGWLIFFYGMSIIDAYLYFIKEILKELPFSKTILAVFMIFLFGFAAFCGSAGIFLAKKFKFQAK